MTPEQAKKVLPLITAYANGQTVEWRRDWGQSPTPWYSVERIGFPGWGCETIAIRIKPEVIKYRRALMHDTDGKWIFVVNNACKKSVTQVESSSFFVRWIDNDWVEYEV